ncbi:hypothetical protein, partial [Reyranella sp.]|uniref:hypothetical protein n=1 Tax=Reyranella sp. TaxID=1929291 RepID=UPI00403513F6
MKKMVTALAAAMMLGVMATVTACGGTQQERQDKADQTFGRAKLALVTATATVGLYNVLCQDALAQSAVCARSINEYVNSGITAAAEIIERSERVFAAANSTDGDKLDAAKAAMAAIEELTAALA